MERPSSVGRVGFLAFALAGVALSGCEVQDTSSLLFPHLRRSEIFGLVDAPFFGDGQWGAPSSVHSPSEVLEPGEGRMNTDTAISRRTLSTLLGAAPMLLLGRSGLAAAAPDAGRDGETLQSEFLMELVLERGATSNVGPAGATRVAVAIASGSFQGPRLRGTLVAPAGDWIVGRPDGSSVLDVRVVMQTDDEQKILVTWRGIAYPMPGGALHARILPLFETGSARYAWLNNVVAVGVLRPVPGKISYRVYEIL